MKSLLPLLQPLGLVWMLLGSWVAVTLYRRHWRVACLPGCCWLLLTLVSCTPLASLLISRLEGGHAPFQSSGEALADAIVCLGGAAEPSDLEPSGFHLRAGADRLSTALVLFARQEAPNLVLGGGGYESGGTFISEADQVATMIASLTATTGAITSLGVCSDTHEEALKVAALCKQRGWQRILLVTSAFHMPRAASVFQKAGVPYQAVPCNYLSSTNRVGDLHWVHLPHPESFAVFNAWLHEVIGTWMYRRRGWM